MRKVSRAKQFINSASYQALRAPMLLRIEIMNSDKLCLNRKAYLCLGARDWSVGGVVQLRVNKLVTVEEVNGALPSGS